MNVLVLYQSRGGHTRQAAETIARAARSLGHGATVKSVIEANSADVASADALFIGTWVQGFIVVGVKPAGADLWVPALPSLDGKPVGVFCTYVFSPRGSLRRLTALLEGRGARVVGQRALRRWRLDAGAEQFTQEVLQQVERFAS